MSKDWLVLIILTLASVVIWTGVDVISNLTSKDVDMSEYTRYTRELEPTMNTEILDEILEKEAEWLMVSRDTLSE